MKIFITGDSHTAALKLGLNMLMSRDNFQLGYQMDIRPLGPGSGLLSPFFIDRGGFAEITDKNYVRRVKRLPFADEQEHYDYYGICGPLTGIGLWAKKKSCWQKYTPFTPQGDQAPISTSLLRHAVLRHHRYTLQLVELLKRVGVMVFVIEAPKPYNHHPSLNMANRDVIAYIELFSRKIMTERLASIGVPTINIPGECYDAEGFMLDSFRHENPADNCHANNEFGALMVKEIGKFLESGR